MMVREVINGALYTTRRASYRRVLECVVADLSAAISGWHLRIEPSLHLAGNQIVADIAGWRRERVERLPDAPFFEVVPDWVCEITTAETARLVRAAKLPEYLRLGVNQLWLLNPVGHILEPFQRQGSHWTIKCASVHDEPLRASPFDAVELSMTPWWLPPDPADQPR